MRIFLGIVLPTGIQVVVVLLVISMNQGNGSWAGLGALLLGMFAIPITLIINGLYIWKNPQHGLLQVFGKCFSLAAVVPVLCIFLLAV